MKEKMIFILGATGQLGSEMARLYASRPKGKIRPLTHLDLDVTDTGKMKDLIERERPWAIANCTAYNHVDAAQEEPEKAFAVNAAAVAVMAAICSHLGIYLIHFSTDYVFDGKKGGPYREEDPLTPLNLYGLSKLAGEQAVRIRHPQRHCIIRTCGLYGLRRSPTGKRNFVEAILTQASGDEILRVRNDLVLSPTYARELAEAADQLIEREALGTFHAANTGSCSWFEFAREILKQEGIQKRLEPTLIPSAPPSGTPRPVQSVLDISKLQNLGIHAMSSWQEALSKYLAARKNENGT